MFGLRTIVSTAALLMAATFGIAAPASAGSVEPAGSPADGRAVTMPGAVPGTSGGGADAQCLDFLFPGTNIRAEPNTGGAIRGQGNPGDCVDMHGSVTGQNTYCPEGSFWTDQWYDVTNERTGVRGLVLRCYIG